MPVSAPRVSIGLPVYNGAEFLADALHSLLSQTYEDFEIVISDNGSNDDTEEICRDFAARDTRIRYLRYAENRGAYWNFNNAFRESRGEYFRWAAHDDMCEPELLEHCVRALDEDPTVVWTQGTQVFIDPQGNRLPPTGDVEKLDGRGRSEKPHVRFADVLLGHSSSQDICSLEIFSLMRRDALQRTRLLLHYYGSEKVLLGELSLIGRHQKIHDADFLQRIHPKMSGNLKSAAEQQKWCDPSRTLRVLSPRLRLLRGHIGSVMRHSLTLSQRFGCFVAISKYLLQVRKWKKVIMSALTRKGVGGGYHEQVSQRDKEVQATS